MNGSYVVGVVRLNIRSSSHNYKEMMSFTSAFYFDLLCVHKYK